MTDNSTFEILVVDDDRAIRDSISFLLKRKGYRVATAASDSECVALLRTRPFALILMDMNYSLSTSGEEGLALLRKARILQPDTPVILISAWGSIELAVEGMRLGAFDFITKPWHNLLLLQRIETALALHSDSPTDTDTFDTCGIIGNSPQMMRLLETVQKVAATDAPVLILGENGTGKELIANAIHRNSKRAQNPFVMVNLGGVSQSLFESEMFGHTKGAYTGATSHRTGRFEAADKGTIFLDEIGELDLSCQVKLLRVLQQHTFERLGETVPVKVDFRPVCATNADLKGMVQQRTFREDLLYRINLITLHVPPLRERRDDIPLLVEHFLKQHSAITGDQVRITPAAMSMLCRYNFPGNIRQLKNIVERAAILCSDNLIEPEHIDFGEPDSTDCSPASDSLSGVTLEELERKAIETAVTKFGGNMSRAAASLGITRQSLYRKLEKYGITPPQS